MEGYQLAAGHHFNLKKSQLLFGNSRQSFKARVLRSLGIPHAFFPSKYLGVPLFIGSPKAHYFEILKESFRQRLSGWKKNLISLAGRVILVKHVLQSLSIHILLVLPIPSSICNFLEKWMKNFLWSGGPAQSKRSFLNWNSVCQPKSEGGLGFWSLQGPDSNQFYQVRLGGFLLYFPMRNLVQSKVLQRILSLAPYLPFLWILHLEAYNEKWAISLSQQPLGFGRW